MLIETNDKRLNSIIEILNITTQGNSIMEAKDSILPTLVDILKLKRISIGVLNAGSIDTMRIIYTDFKTEFHKKYGIETDYLKSKNSFDIPIDVYPDIIKAHILENRGYLYIDNLKTRDYDELQQMIGDKYNGIAIFPIVSDDRCLGIISCYLSDGESLKEEDIELTLQICKVLALMIEIYRKNEIISSIEKKKQGVC